MNAVKSNTANTNAVAINATKRGRVSTAAGEGRGEVTSKETEKKPGQEAAPGFLLH